MPKLYRLKNDGFEAYIFKCPGCASDHMVAVGYTVEYAIKCREAGRGVPVWGFNHDLEKPTFTPSLLVREYLGDEVVRICHSFIREGKIEFLGDCTHDLKGKTVPLHEVEDA